MMDDNGITEHGRSNEESLMDDILMGIVPYSVITNQSSLAGEEDVNDNGNNHVAYEINDEKQQEEQRDKIETAHLQQVDYSVSADAHHVNKQTQTSSISTINRNSDIKNAKDQSSNTIRLPGSTIQLVTSTPLTKYPSESRIPKVVMIEHDQIPRPIPNQNHSSLKSKRKSSASLKAQPNKIKIKAESITLPASCSQPSALTAQNVHVLDDLSQTKAKKRKLASSEVLVASQNVAMDQQYQDANVLASIGYNQSTDVKKEPQFIPYQIQQQAPYQDMSNASMYATYPVKGNAVKLEQARISQQQGRNVKDYQIRAGEIYTGRLNESNQPDGYGKQVSMSSGDVYEGNFLNGCRHGKGILCVGISNGGGKYVGEWINDRPNGTGSFEFGFGIDKTHQRISGGFDVLKYKIGTYKGNFVNGNPHGMGVREFENGDVYIGEFVRGMIHGRGSYTCSSGDRYVGEFRYGSQNGLGVTFFHGGGRYIGEFKDGEYYGSGRIEFANLDVFEGNFRNNEIFGKGRYMFANGLCCEGEFRGTNVAGNIFITNESGESFMLRSFSSDGMTPLRDIVSHPSVSHEKYRLKGQAKEYKISIVTHFDCLGVKDDPSSTSNKAANLLRTQQYLQFLVNSNDSYQSKVDWIESPVRSSLDAKNEHPISIERSIDCVDYAIRSVIEQKCTHSICLTNPENPIKCIVADSRILGLISTSVQDIVLLTLGDVNNEEIKDSTSSDTLRKSMFHLSSSSNEAQHITFRDAAELCMRNILHKCSERDQMAASSAGNQRKGNSTRILMLVLASQSQPSWISEPDQIWFAKEIINICVEKDLRLVIIHCGAPSNIVIKLATSLLKME